MGKHHMKTILQIAALTVGLAVAGTASAQDAAQSTAPAATPAQTAEPAPESAEDWNPFSRSDVKIYLTDVKGFVTTDGVISATVAKVPLTGGASDYGYSADQIEVRCSAKQSRLVYSIEYGANGVQTDRFDEPEEWAVYAPDTRDAYLAQLVCDGDRTTKSYPSIKAFIDGGRQ